MIQTKVGYTGGENPNPSYQSVCNGDGHTEALQIQYNSSEVSYEKLLDFYWSQYKGAIGLRQYRSAIWAHDAEQREASIKSIAAAAIRTEDSSKFRVRVMDAQPWHDAEDYHQKHHAKLYRKLDP